MKTKCLSCYQEIPESERKGGIAFHTACSKQFFKKNIPPLLAYSQQDMIKLAEQVVKSQKTVTGVQPKLSLGLQRMKEEPQVERFTIVGLWGEYILKPQTEMYEHLPENEDVTMHLAALADIQTVKHSLIRLSSGELAYITKRVDREKKTKIHMEDMCQLTERQTEHKYKGSYEQIAKTIRKYSQVPGLDVVNFYELVVFSFLTGNNDMHLKNFSLLKDPNVGYRLCPAYDLIASALVVEGDDEELALNLNGKKKKLKRIDFIQAMRTGGMNAKAIENVMDKFPPLKEPWKEKIRNSFLPTALMDAYCELLEERFEQLEMS